MDDDNFIFVLKSEIRFYILVSLKNKSQTPTELAKNSKFYLSHISKNLKDLLNQGFVHCENCDSSKNKKFTISKKGKNCLKIINKLTNV